MSIIPPAVDRTEALADFLLSTLGFAAGFMRFTTPHRYAFLIDPVRKISSLKRAEYLALTLGFLPWIQAYGSKDKVKALWRWMKSSWSTPGKFMFEWMVKARDDPWETMTECVRLASEFAVWFRSDSPHVFMGAVGLQFDAAQEMFLLAKVALLACNVTLSDLLDHKSLSNRTVIL